MFRILALDGGGIRGAFTAGVLAELEENIGQPIDKHFDLIVGTSTGAILALGLASGLRASQIEDLYIKHGGRIFPSGRLSAPVRVGRGLFLPKHSRAPLEEVLEELLGQLTMADLSTRVVVPIFSVHKGKACTFKTNHHADCWHDREVRVVDVALAATAAPTYFGAVGIAPHKQREYIDGGIWANTPVLVGIAEAVAFCGQQLSEIAMLSVGTTASIVDVATISEGGRLAWAPKILDTVFAGQATGALNQARLLLGEANFFRIDQPVARAAPLDDARPRTVRGLSAIGHGTGSATATTRRVAGQFLDGNTVSPFTRFAPPKGEA